jgi:hypothetical protein
LTGAKALAMSNGLQTRDDALFHMLLHEVSQQACCHVLFPVRGHASQLLSQMLAAADRCHGEEEDDYHDCQDL